MSVINPRLSQVSSNMGNSADKEVAKPSRSEQVKIVSKHFSEEKPKEPIRPERWKSHKENEVSEPNLREEITSPIRPERSKSQDEFSDISMDDETTRLSMYSDIDVGEMTERMSRLEVSQKINFYTKKIAESLKEKPTPEPERRDPEYVPVEVEIVLSDLLGAKKSKLKSNVVQLYDRKHFKEINSIWKYNNELNNSENWDELSGLDDSVLITLKIVKSLKEIKIKDWDYLRSMFRTLKIATRSKIVFYKSAIASRLLKKSILIRILTLITHQDEYEISKVADDIIIYYEDIIIYNDHIVQNCDLLISILSELSHFCDPRYVAKCTRMVDKMRQKKFNFLKIFPTNILESNVCFRNSEIYDGISHYVKTHVAFLKEDFEISLRKGLKNYINGIKDKENIHVYKDVKLCFSKFSGDNYIDYYIQMNNDQICDLRKTHWPSSSKFYCGSLILLSHDNFKTYFLAQCTDRREIEKGTGRLPFLFLIVPREIDLKSTYTMIEPNDYFDPYCSVMKCLKMMPKYYFPFQKYILFGQNDVRPPLYMRGVKNFKIKGHNVDVDDIYSYPNDLGLNVYQKRCLFDALNKEVCLIQGPPGTGKTFTTKLIIKVLLENRRLWSQKYNTPILVVCFKNLSLDELLDGLLKEGVNVLRLGSNTKNEELVNYYSLNGMEKPENAFSVNWTFAFLRKKEKEIRTEIDEAISGLESLEKNEGVVKFEKIQKILKMKDIVYLKPIFIEWLFSLDKKTTDSLNVLKTTDYEILHPEKQDVQILEPDLYSKIAKKMNDLFRSKSRNDLLDLDAETITKSEDKYAMYHLWVEKLKIEYKNDMTRLTRMLTDVRGQLFETFRIFDARKIAQSNIDVMGMTTTASARLDVMIEEIKPRILIVEEAAEVLESHCVAALNQHCEHLILLGDHKQLRPLAKNIELERYNMTLSLFERLANNGLNPSILGQQYRMRPEISTLITPAIYEQLEDDESVKTFPDVRGATKNVFFIDHRNEENKSFATNSVFNRFEIHFALNLSLYFINQGYDGSEITIIAMYAEQEKILHRERAYLKNDYPEIDRVIIATVDSYQGKENKIVLLSLVRNNKFANIGFLNVVNRVCVALSRAMHGLYIFGNMDNLRKKSPMWRTVEEKLKRQNAIGPSLTIVCKPHGRRTVINGPDELRNHRNGGCDQPCKTKLACGHTCTYPCHGRDFAHLQEFACILPCQEMMDCGHRCQAKCHPEDIAHVCQPCQDIKDSNKMDTVETKDVKKETKKGKKKDSDDSDSPDNIPDIDFLTKICEFKFDCGHDCGRNCTEHNSELKCEKKCLKKLTCGHHCKLRCHIGFDHKGEYSCGEICGQMLKCGHFCGNKCHPDRDKKHMIVNRCKRICGQSLKCGHRCGYECHAFADDGHSGDYACSTPCDEGLPCGHLCVNDCHQNSPENHDCSKCIL